MITTLRSRAPQAVAFSLALAAFGLVDTARAAVPSASIAASLVGQGGFGTIKGRLVWGGDDVPKQKVSVEQGQSTKDPAICAATTSILDNDLVIDPKTKGVQYAFVYLVKPNGANPDAAKAILAKTPTVVIDQKNCQFLPYATAMIQDQGITFKSSDPVNHNVHLSPFTNPPFNVILAPNGAMTKNLVAERRVIPLVCDIHPWMKGWIMVFDHPFFAVTEADGSFEIKGVPTGDQNLVVWQAKVGYVNEGLARGMKVSVKSDGTVLDDFKLDPKKIK
jgi:hypothetical protein